MDEKNQEDSNRKGDSISCDQNDDRGDNDIIEKKSQSHSSDLVTLLEEEEDFSPISVQAPATKPKRERKVVADSSSDVSAASSEPEPKRKRCEEAKPAEAEKKAPEMEHSKDGAVEVKPAEKPKEAVVAPVPTVEESNETSEGVEISSDLDSIHPEQSNFGSNLSDLMPIMPETIDFAPVPTFEKLVKRVFLDLKPQVSFPLKNTVEEKTKIIQEFQRKKTEYLEKVSRAIKIKLEIIKKGGKSPDTLTNYFKEVSSLLKKIEIAIGYYKKQIQDLEAKASEHAKEN